MQHEPFLQGLAFEHFHREVRKTLLFSVVSYAHDVPRLGGQASSDLCLEEEPRDGRWPVLPLAGSGFLDEQLERNYLAEAPMAGGPDLSHRPAPKRMHELVSAGDDLADLNATGERCGKHAIAHLNGKPNCPARLRARPHSSIDSATNAAPGPRTATSRATPGLVRATHRRSVHPALVEPRRLPVVVTPAAAVPIIPVATVPVSGVPIE